VISVFHRNVDDICLLLGCYTACCGKSLPTFRGKASVPSGVKKYKENLRMKRIGFPEKSVRISHYTLRNNSEECRSKTELRLTDLLCVVVLLYKISLSLRPRPLLPRRLYGDKYVYKHLAPPSERNLKR
jgi:hypothetical protein